MAKQVSSTVERGIADVKFADADQVSHLGAKIIDFMTKYPAVQALKIEKASTVRFLDLPTPEAHAKVVAYTHNPRPDMQGAKPEEDHLVQTWFVLHPDGEITSREDDLHDELELEDAEDYSGLMQMREAKKIRIVDEEATGPLTDFQARMLGRVLREASEASQTA